MTAGNTLLNSFVYRSKCIRRDMTSYFTSCVGIFTRGVHYSLRVHISQGLSVINCFTYLTRSTERLPTLPSNISTISMTVVMTTYSIRVRSVALNIRCEIILWTDTP